MWGLGSPDKVKEREALPEKVVFHFVLSSEEIPRHGRLQTISRVSQQDSHEAFRTHSGGLLLKLDIPFKRIPVALTTGTFSGFGVVVLHLIFGGLEW